MPAKNKKTSTFRQIVKIGGLLKEIVTVTDASGKILHRMANPLMLEFRGKDLVQVIVGSTLLAVPVMFTEEVWILGNTLPVSNIVYINILSILFIAAFVYYNFYRRNLKGHWHEFIKRAVAIYVMSFLVVGLLLTLLDKAPWTTDWVLAVKRAVLVAFPASMSAAVADMLK